MERYIIIAANLHDYEEGDPFIVRDHGGLDENIPEEDGSYPSENLGPLIFDNIVDAQHYRDTKVYKHQNPKIIRVADLTNSNNFYERDEEEK